ncbi:MAG: DUF2062 domain-containing protein [Verrucomicrobiales bacterium]|nr:DUF2062 domain-containing protein [Verrucomicrobiales bacterium]
MSIEAAPRIGVLIPVFNHGLTVARVIRGARQILPVFVVNDGSSDSTADGVERERVAAEKEGHPVIVVSHPVNRGKAAALKTGFEAALRDGYSHLITLDADGQHAPEELPGFIELCRRHPDALLIGVRDLVKEGAPWARRFSNGLSTFWFRQETGVPLTDTQCGYRCYPLKSIVGLRIRAGRYAYELEVMVKASWAGVPIVAHPVSADYAAPTSRLSHFKPWRDMWQISALHSRLSMQTFCVPALLRKISASGELDRLPRRRRIRTIVGHLLSEHTDTSGRVGAAVGVGLFFGIAPIWGFQMMAAAAAAHRMRLNKAIAVAASNISFPLAAPFILAAGLVLGHWVCTGGWIDFSPSAVRQQITQYAAEWVLGSFLLATIVGVLGGLAFWGMHRVIKAPSAVSPNG